MDDKNIKNFPKALASIAEATKAMGFDMASEPKTGALLRTLASSKPKGQFLELGTGTGLSAAWPGKFSHLKLALNLLAEGGIYIIDDLLPQANWPDGHAPKVPKLIAELESLVGFKTVQLAWASGLMLVTKQ